MRIAIDVSGTLGERTGISGYTEGLLAGLARAGGRHEYLLYASFWRGFRERSAAIRPPSPAFSKLLRRFPERLDYLAEYGPGLRLREPGLLRAGVDLFHGAANLAPRLKRIPAVITLHGYEPPEQIYGGLGPWGRFYWGRMLDLSIRGAAHVITASGWTRARVLERFGLPPERVSVVPLGVDASVFRPGPADPARLAALGVRRPFVLAIGHSPERRNTKALLAVFRSLADAGRTDASLVIANGAAIESDPYYRELAGDWEPLKAAGRLTALPLLPPEAMADLYRGAELLAYPSLLEGFGLPIAEAMSCGCPVLTSRRAPMSDVAAGAAALADPESRKELEAALGGLLGDAGLRRGLAAAGLEKAAGFSLDAMAARTVEIYERASHG